MRLRHWLLAIGIAICLTHPSFAYHRPRAYQATSQTIYQKHLPKTRESIVGTQQLESELNSIVNSESSAAIAVYVKNMKSGAVLYTRNINHPLMPASTLKILTAEAALLFLGADFQFATKVLTDAKSVRNGILQGNLYIVLNGDPTLTYFDVAELMLSLKANKFRAIQGNVYIDNTAYDQSFYGPGWEWQDKSYCYAAPISASIINHNCLSFKVSPSKLPGRSAQVVTLPNYFYPHIKNTVVTKPNRASRGPCTMHLTTSQNNEVTIDGCMPKGDYTWGVSYVVTDIPSYNVALFKNVLHQLSINVYGNVGFAHAPDNLSLIGTHNSKPLRLLINEMLKKSDNIIAGALFKKLGQVYSHRPGSWANGSAAVADILRHHAGLNTLGLRNLDGSGLSPSNLTTPYQMMQVLDFAYHNYAISYEFISALPIAGVDGTLKHRMGNIARKVRAKTGTISGVVSLAGYAVSDDKDPLAFVIMINGSKGLGWHYKSLEDRIATALTKYRKFD